MSIILRLLRDQKRFNKLFLFLSNFENNFFQIDRLKIKNPFSFVECRSGTTFLTHLLTHQIILAPLNINIFHSTKHQFFGIM